MPFYYPVLTDTTALTIGAVLFYAFLAENRPLMFIAAAVGAFTWPTMLYLALPLLLFPPSAARPAAPLRPAPFAVFAAPAMAMVAVALFRYYVKHDVLSEDKELPWPSMVPLAAACVFVYLAASMRWLLDRNILQRLLRPYRETSVACVLLCATLVILVKLAVRFWLVPSSPGISVKYFITATCMVALAKPAIFFVAHVVYFGPIVGAAVFFWPEVARNVRALGLGAVLAVILTLLMGITSESRHLTPFIPLLVAMTVQAMDRPALSYWHDVAFALLALFVSKIWLPINAGPFHGARPSSRISSISSNHGPWMSGLSYFVQGTVIVGVAIVLAGWYRRGKREGVTLTSKALLRGAWKGAAGPQVPGL